MLFYKCEKITGTIPRDLFKYATNVVTMANIFNTTTGITGEIPPELFKNCTNVTNFRFSFAGTNLSGEIPESLFKNNKEAKNFNGTFAECNNLEGTLPSKIFENNDKITTIKTFLYRANNVSVEEIYICSKNLIDAEETGFVNRNNRNIKIYVPKDSQTETTLKGCFSGNTNVIIEYI